uniref:26S proteasome non-ATPase regulatory subunit 3 N-terminal TPR repeats domain-containing protein n=1 Tax=Brassica campestris TaxID=3711 RepID=M4DN51_BRACM
MWLFSASVTRLNNLNKRTRDVMASSLYVYYSLRYEMTGDLDDILTGDLFQSIVFDSTSN